MKQHTQVDNGINVEAELEKWDASIRWCASNFIKKYKLGAHTFDDLLQCGKLAFCRAAITYDPASGQFSTYAFKWVRSKMQGWVYSFKGVVRHSSSNQIVSIDQQPDDESNSDCYNLPELTHYDAAIPDENPELRDIINKLPIDIRRAVELRFGLNGELPHTEGDIMEKLGRSREDRGLNASVLTYIRRNFKTELFNMKRRIKDENDY